MYDQNPNVQMTDSKKAKIIKATNDLQKKVGAGPLNEAVVERCQSVIDNNTVDFAPLAEQYLDLLAKAVEAAKTGSGSREQIIHDMTAPVMQLKANAATFRYHLIGNLANVMLSFLEAVKTVDQDAVQIVDAHHKTLKAIVLKKMQGDGGEYGKLMENELKSACQRYFSRKS